MLEPAGEPHVREPRERAAASSLAGPAKTSSQSGSSPATSAASSRRSGSPALPRRRRCAPRRATRRPPRAPPGRRRQSPAGRWDGVRRAAPGSARTRRRRGRRGRSGAPPPRGRHACEARSVMPGAGRVVVDHLVDDGAPGLTDGERHELGRREAHPQHGRARGSRRVPSSCRASQRRLTASTTGARRGGRSFGETTSNGAVRAARRRAPGPERPQHVPRPRVADPELLHVRHLPAAGGEPRHLLLGLGVVEAEGEVRVEEELALHAPGAHCARRCAGAPRRRRGASRRASRSSGRRMSRRRGSRRAGRSPPREARGRSCGSADRMNGGAPASSARRPG